MMRITRMAIVAASVLAAGCASDGTTSPAASSPTKIETRLIATGDVQSLSVGDPSVTVKVTVRSELTEMVTGGACAQTIEARAVNGTSWTDVSSRLAACSANAIILAPGGTVNINAVADQAAVRQVAGGSGENVVLRARHSLAGANTTYTLQTAEITMKLP
jgi:hypothetical protein